jgi:hypothetical protein
MCGFFGRSMSLSMRMHGYCNGFYKLDSTCYRKLLYCKILLAFEFVRCGLLGPAIQLSLALSRGRGKTSCQVQESQVIWVASALEDIVDMK